MNPAIMIRDLFGEDLNSETIGESITLKIKDSLASTYIKDFICSSINDDAATLISLNGAW